MYRGNNAIRGGRFEEQLRQDRRSEIMQLRLVRGDKNESSGQLRDVGDRRPAHEEITTCGRPRCSSQLRKSE